MYDSANQLVRENNQAGNFTHTWTYDSAGNILERKEYAYTTGELGTPTDTVSYTYGNTNWGDLLTAYDGTAFTYETTDSGNTIGNLLSDGTWTYTWQHGRQLASMTDGTVTWLYTYNADGMRTRRTNGAFVYEYVYNGSQLSRMTVSHRTSRTLNTLYFAYDASGTPMAVTYNNTVYYYVTNIQGDVTGIVDSTGTAVVTYTYDAWGNILSTDGTMKDTLGTHNPLRYRSYVYDQETELYYLQSRYYNPELGRFLNADAFAATGAGLLGNNMFAYCNNNPVILFDPTGLCSCIGTRASFIDCGRADCSESANYFPITTAIGISGSVGIGPFVYGGQIALVTDSWGYSEIQVTYYSPISSSSITGTPSVDEMLTLTNSFDKITDVLEFSLMGNMSFYNTPSVENLYGTGYQIGGTVGNGPAIAVDYNVVPNGTDTPYGGVTISDGWGTTDVHGTMGATKRLCKSPVSVYDIVEAAYKAFWGMY